MEDEDTTRTRGMEQGRAVAAGAPVLLKTTAAAAGAGAIDVVCCFAEAAQRLGNRAVGAARISVI